MAFWQQRLKNLSITAKNDTSIYCNKHTYYNYKYVYYYNKICQPKKKFTTIKKKIWSMSEFSLYLQKYI